MPHGSCVSPLAPNRLRHSALAERVAAARGLGHARQFARHAAAFDPHPIRAVAALHRAAHRADHAHRAARAGR